ncbi:tumor necrosis factor receptor superfamily member 8 [Perognathus longimembris pacificus]|uniref:tumor necrosis factor receptor superfamily member 8 n=1 Tax=Perognathus longimembris pacificus TaxID=214514 RepID=UPI002019A02D|nr:tumor necrosis factor receptor superfamily member 8 [Perognathus longimembris pacificus]
MRALLPAVLPLLLGTLRAFPQVGATAKTQLCLSPLGQRVLAAHPASERAWKSTCAGDPSFYHDQASGKCCYRCPSRWTPLTSCPQGSADCRKQCEPDYYLNEAGRCTACVRCLRDDLVEQAPCSGSSSRICKCRPGMFCFTSAVNSCARCRPHSACAAGLVVHFPGTAEKDTVCGLPPSLPGPSKAGPQHDKTPTSPGPQSTSSLVSPATARTSDPKGSSALRLGGTWNLARTPGSHADPAVRRWFEDAPPLAGMAERDTTLEPPPSGTSPDYSTPDKSKAPASTPAATLSPLLDSETGRPEFIPTRSLPSTRKPILDPGPVLFWVVTMLLVALGSGSLLLCHRRACQRRIGQKLHLCFPARTFRPKVELLDSRPARTPSESRSISVTEPSPGSLSIPSPPPAELSPLGGAACLESLPLLDASLAEGPLAPRDPPEPRMSTEHTNNRIEKIYIMKADTVIVGTVKTEVPENRGLVGLGESELEAELEVDHAPHYPEQETEPPPGSCEDVMFSVEEEGKEDSWPTTTSEK